MQVPVYKELSSFTPKVVGPFTLRQFTCVVFCVPIEYLIFWNLWPVLGQDITIVLAALPAMLAFAIGWLKPYGMTVEKFLVMYVKTRLMPPHRRKYVIENTVVNSITDAYAAYEREQAAAEAKGKKAARQKKRKGPPEGAIL